MAKRIVLFALAVLIVAPVFLLKAYQKMRHSQQYEWEMQDPVDDPPDADEKTEWAFARLRYHSSGGFGGGFRGFRGGRRGGFGGRSSWGIDSNRADRDLSRAVRRLTRIHVRSVEEVIDIDDGPIFDWPWLYAVEVGRGGFIATDQQAKRLRDYLDRGGFFMVDDFHGTYEWENFMRSLQRVFPDRSVVDIPNDDPIFHILHDLSDRVQVPGAQFLRSGRTYEQDGYEPRWRAIYDDKGRIQVAICHNMDLGDAWQYADDPAYPEKYASESFRIGVNYIVYSMTH